MNTIMSLFKLMRVIWVIFKWHKTAHFILIDLKKDLPMPILPFFDTPSFMLLKP